MKALRHPIILAILVFTFWSCGTSQSHVYSQGYDGYGYYEDAYYDQGGGISFNVFYNELRPHGRWINNRSYGRVWVPGVGRDFHPYATNGYWVMTDHGNMWVSNYSWGWAPFHYGRWYWDDYYGWAWITGYEWAPAWVTWRSGGGYYGWAPMGPGVNINININLPGHYWTFLPDRYMYQRNMHRHYNRYSPTIYNRTTIINNTYIYNDNRYYSGPSASDYRSATGRSTTVRRLESSNNRSGRATVVNNNSVRVYRPETSGRSTTGRSSTSGNVTNNNSRSTTTNRSATTGNVNSSTSRSSSTNRSATTGNVNSSTSRSSSTNRSATTNRSANTGSSSTVRSSSSTSNSGSRNATVRSSSSSSSNNNSATSRSTSGRSSSGRR